VCFTNDANRVLVPCGHLMCGDCLAQLPRQLCPFDRTRIQATCPFYPPT
jgi:hypothetical protein